ncbi:MAG: GntR family transcriptional regulator, partial [bacterium]|nr:GntR family transcriptional regulator [bacterium]
MEHTKYKMIFETLRSEICSGKYETRKFLSEAQLVRRFGVARFTVVQALEGLRKAGLVVRRKGKGTFLTAFARTATGPIGLI